ncbi:ASCH domain-containing protein [Frondihabitans australicus]|uniref:Uncharacterized protein YhfF n=1 Tax=Frondihabitans australicus TaxID=386892 RepID=A0A495ILB8_9MICO|nr:ASCH domain-containing protein [Frondihabitans australicus]RKR76559.1 uncharacterized protein YhfF [Frondihabitans australicus]
MLTDDDVRGLPISEFAFPGPLRDQLVAAILDGSKTSTTALLWEYEAEGSPLPVVGEREAVIDSDGAPVCITEVTAVEVVPLGEVGLAHAIDEGEGYETVAAWRAGHEEFYASDDYQAEYSALTGGSHFAPVDTTPAVLTRFRVVAR